MYVIPRLVTDPADCYWYHAMDLPEIGTVGGAWDLRDTIDEYLGRFDFRGKRCLDLGPASGYLTFEMERRGASEVVAVDLDVDAESLELVPFADPTHDAAERLERVHRIRRGQQNAFWMAHRLLGSRARVYYGNGYHLPPELGQFDVVMIGMMLPHVERPFRVLEQAAARSDRHIIVTQPAPQMPDAWAYFMPNPRTLAPFDAWWSMSEDCVARMLDIVGFDVVSRIRAEHACPRRGDRELCTAMVAERRIARR